jgi:hypothetical protein
MPTPLIGRTWIEPGHGGFSGKKSSVGCMTILRRKAILGAGLFLENNRWQEKKHARGK